MTARRLLDPQRSVQPKQLEGFFDVALIWLAVEGSKGSESVNGQKHPLS
jgi:hypothetical protein